MASHNDIAATAAERQISTAWILAAILLLGLALRFFLLPFRWINPDEGAHLMDARLLLEGHFPIADFGSRQPLYVLLIAALLKVFGISYWVGRLLPIFSSVGVAWLLYLFGKKWRSEMIGLIAAAAYLFLPLVLVWSVIVKTEQLAIFFAVASMLLLIKSADRRWWSLFLAGIFAACAFYVRQPTLYLPLAAVVYFIWQRKHALKSILLYGAGYLTLTVLVFMIYSTRMSLSEMLFSQLNPLNLIWNRVLHLFGMLPEQYRIVDEAGFRFLGQSLDYTLGSWYHALSTTLFIVLAAIGAVIKKEKQKDSVKTLLLLWTGFAVLLYFYQSASRGFYSQYFTEALPPLVLLAAIILEEFYKRSILDGKFITAISAVIFYGLYAGQQLFHRIHPGMAGYFVISLGLAFILYCMLFNSTFSAGRIVWLLVPVVISGALVILIKRTGLHDLWRFTLVVLILYVLLAGFRKYAVWDVHEFRLMVLAMFVFAALQSGLLLGSRYESIWSQHTLGKTATFLQNRAEASDTVLCGGMIWTFESGLQPFLNVAHPTEFLKHRYIGFEDMLSAKPPQFIILDGYTHRKFVKYWPFLKEFMELKYNRVGRFEGSKYPVDVFQIMPRLQLDSSFIAEEGHQR